MINIILYMHWWFWVLSIISIFLSSSWLFVKTREDPLMLRLSGIFASCTFIFMMLHSILDKEIFFIEYMPLITALFTSVVVIACVLIVIGCYQKGSQSDFDPNLRKAIHKFLYGGIIFLLCLGLFVFIVYLI